tara:strand:+ start:54 stop:1085 length:1032 start_codon:yes stop_codon:yes gene_type:complete
MLITFLDDSVVFDGRSPAIRAMGGSEKTLVAIAAALSRRGHTVRVFNRCRSAVVIDGVSWQPIETCEAAHSDWLIANRKPTLLAHIPRAEKVALLVSGHAGYLEKPAPLKAMKTRRPTLLLQTFSQSTTVPQSLQVSAAEVLRPATVDCYRLSREMTPVSPKRVVVTTHPKNGMIWLVRLWNEKISFLVPGAELHIYSALLSKESEVRVPAPELSEILHLVAESSNSSIKIFLPLSDAKMAEIYGAARAHLYPGDSRDLLCSTLGDSQACGLPAVSRDLGGVRERVLNNKTGFVTVSDDSFRDRVTQLINDDDLFWDTSKAAKKEQSKRSWDDVASELEQIFT